jgi:hypothetical protein
VSKSRSSFEAMCAWRALLDAERLGEVADRRAVVALLGKERAAWRQLQQRADMVRSGD